MSSEGQPFQFDLFSGELVDNRSAHQKRKDKNRNAAQQLQMFSPPEIAGLAGNARPWLNDSPAPLLVLEIQDTRTPEEVERALMREAEKDTLSFLDEPAVAAPLVDAPQTIDVNISVPSGIIFEARHASRPTGLRARLRAQSIPVRAHRSPVL